MTTSSETYLIAGLGNPGRGYRNNRHNVGFMFIDHLAKTMNVRLSRLQMKALTTTGRFGGAKLILAKPQTMMNRSGKSVASLTRYFQIPLERVFVVYDDLDLPHADLRLKPAGGSGGHKGLQSIIKELGSVNFPRLRLGIGRPPGRMDPADYVLQDFSEAEVQSMQTMLQDAQICLNDALTQGMQAAMTRCNTSGDGKA